MFVVSRTTSASVERGESMMAFIWRRAVESVTWNRDDKNNGGDPRPVGVPLVPPPHVFDPVPVRRKPPLKSTNNTTSIDEISCLLVRLLAVWSDGALG